MTKDYLNTFISSKVDINDFLNTVNSLDQHIKQKPSFDEIKYLSEEKITKKELNEILVNYINKKDFENFIGTIPKSFDLKDLNFNTNNKIDSIINDINKKFISIPTKQEINKLNNLLNSKADISEIQKILSFKVDKNDLNNMLKEKVDYNYMENLLKQKLDNNILGKIENDVNSKVNLEDFEKMAEKIDKKIDIDMINNLMKLMNNKIDKKYLDDYSHDILLKERAIYDNKFKELDIDFDRFIESVKNQFDNINQVVNKLSKDKIDKTFFEERLNIKLDKKKLISEIDKINQEYNIKFNKMNSKNQETFENLNLKINELKLDINIQFDGLKDNIRNTNKELDSLTNNMQYNFDILIKEKNNHEFFQKEITDKLQNLFDKIDLKIDKNIFNKNIIKIQEDLKKLIMNITHEKISYNEVEQLLKQLNNKSNEIMSNFKNNFDSKFNEINTQLLSLNKNKISLLELNEILNDRLNEINNELSKCLSINDFSNVANKIKNISDNLSIKLDRNSFYEFKKEINDMINKINNELLNKYNKNEEDNLLNEKCNLITFNSVIKEIYNLIDTKLDSIDYQKFIDIQEVINNIYLTENSSGIWKWVSSKLNNGYMPLEIEYYNTMRDNYLWEEDRTSLLIVKGGVYNVKIVIFTNNNDIKIILVVNGENTIIKEGEHVQNRENIYKNNKFALQCVKIDEFLNINDKVRISILVIGKSNDCRGYLKISSVHFEQDKDFDIKNTKYVEEQLNDNQKRIFPVMRENDLIKD